MFESAGKNLAFVSIQRGIFQGDSLSPLVIIICLLLFLVLLKQAKQRYNQTKNQAEKINLLYIDDLTIFGKKKN